MADEPKDKSNGLANQGDETQSISPDFDPQKMAGKRQTDAGHPETVGPYKILEPLGEGGMGTVYLAQQTTPVHRRVALKIVKLGMDTRQTLARFEAEREALAIMNHSGVAKVFDAGVSEKGRPYFVMEYVPGVPVTEYCDKNRLGTNDRLQLFIRVCQAVQHAHQKGIIHRDIKPSNVLVSVQDGTPVPKVIDFGIAKATQQRLTEQTFFTEQGQFIGTPGYMSPEQAGMTATDIDTRTDVYSLGVLLYELLVGTRPFDDASLRRAGFAEIQRIIREVEPPKPSTRLSGLGDHSSQVATNRRTEVRTLNRVLRGDLDWVVMKCLEKNRNRRYDTANALAMEVARFLNSEPVLAGPPSAAYRLRKLVRRNRVAVTAGVVVTLALTIGLGAALYGMTEARRQRAVAEQARIEAEAAAEAERKARRAETERAEELRQVAQFQKEQLAGIDVPLMGVYIRNGLLEKVRAVARPNGKEEMDAHLAALEESVAGADFTGLALDLLNDSIFERSIRAINEQFDTQPLVRAQLLQAMADTARELGLYDRAEMPQETALDIRRRQLGDDDPLTLQSINQTGRLLENQGNLTEAEDYYRKALQGRRNVLGDDHPDTLSSAHNTGSLLRGQGKLGEAESVLRKTMEASRRVLGDTHVDTLNQLNSLGLVLADQGKFAEAERCYREALEGRRRVLGDDHPSTLLSISNFAGLLSDQGQLAEAEVLLREVLEANRRSLGDDHPSTLRAVHNLGFLLLQQKKLVEAEPFLREALERKRRILGSDHPSTIYSINNVGAVLHEQGKHDEAEPYYHEALAACRRVLGDEHPVTIGAIGNMGLILNWQGKFEETLALLRGPEALARRYWSGRHPTRLGGYLAKLGEAHAGLQAFSLAEGYLREAYDLLSAGFGSDHEVTAKCASQLVALYAVWHAKEPGQGYDAEAAKWRSALASP